MLIVKLCNEQNSSNIQILHLSECLIAYMHRHSRSIFIPSKIESDFSDGSENRDLYLSKLNWQEYNLTLGKQYIFLKQQSSEL